jgi:hypothetical protein
MNDPTTYIGNKLVKATPMNRLAYNEYRGWELPANENGEDEGYLIEYLDSPNGNDSRHFGYISWSPKEVFDRAYRNSGNMTFGMAVEGIKQGLKMARRGWNGKGLFIYYVHANRYLAQSRAARDYFGEDAMVPYRDYIAMKTVNEEVVPWVASQSDILAEDWEVAA